ncbi:ABC transporter substrate-binding protein [Marinomonas atlantica]|uniref:ABC transporter substrate-binding protein n=1 Tax=Marinomonas atlantica TaxID=1806668 RepID=UPI00082F5285|nr:ABC transporter substrate-binding protein [Marinomonas atlantica]MCO4784399.1 ABC transporter substrate-binding protein [Marinomonas atlantica]
MRICNAFFAATLVTTMLLLPLASKAEEVNLGFTGPLSGPSSLLGNQLVEGIELGLKRLNGSKELPFTVSLIAKDDGYEPARTVPIIQKLVKDENIVGLISSVGTPTLVAAIPVLKELKLPLISPFTGSSMLQSEGVSSLMFSHRASYQDEVKLLANIVAKEFNIAMSDMAIFAQQDSYGEVTMRSLTKALESHGLKNPSDILHVRYTRNNPSTEEAAAKILARSPQPKAIFLISTYPAAADLITSLDELGVSPLYAALSFVSHEALNSRLALTQAKILSTQLHPCDNDLDSPVIKEFWQDLERYDDPSKATSIILEGYMAARQVEKVLLHFQPSRAPTRAEFLSYLTQYQRLHKNTEKEVVENILLSQTELPIWLELINHGTGHTFCGDTLPYEFLRGSL